jgi:hypothetical protein
MYEWADGGLVWRDPGEENLHVEVAVRDAGDGRFVLGARLWLPLSTRGVTRWEPTRAASALALYDLPLCAQLGRPIRREVHAPVRVEPPTFMRHDEVNDRRFVETVEIEFQNVQVERGQD